MTVGYPDLETSIALVKAMVEAGGDGIELGIPFSDPLADGPTDPAGLVPGAAGRHAPARRA